MAHLNPTADQAASELQSQIAAEREGGLFLVYRRPDGEQRILALAGRERITVGRGDEVDVDLEGDGEVSRLHTELELVGGSWIVADDGISTNGTFIEGERVTRRRLADLDLIVAGGTGLLFRDPGAASGEGPEETIAAVGSEAARSLTETQRSVLVELCRPFAGGESFATPATNKEIAATLFLSVDAIKGHLRVLFEKFDLSEFAQNEKRVKLAEAALRSGAVRPSDLG